MPSARVTAKMRSFNLNVTTVGTDILSIWGFSMNGDTSWILIFYIMENSIRMDIFGTPHLRKSPYEHNIAEI